jgi:hypothetical protein
MNAHFFDFAKQNQKNGHSFKIFFGGVSRQRSFETGSFHVASARQGSLETASEEIFSGARLRPAPLP